MLQLNSLEYKICHFPSSCILCNVARSSIAHKESFKLLPVNSSACEILLKALYIKILAKDEYFVTSLFWLTSIKHIYIFF